MRPEPILDLAQVDLSRVLVDREELRKHNPQRFEFEQIDAVVHIDREKHIIVGYKDARADEFWVRGHMPDFPLLPGVLMCEAGAQLVAYYVSITGYKQSDFIAFGGLENVRFRRTVRPGDRFVLIGKSMRMNGRQTVFNVQGFVGKTMVFHGDIIGVQFNKKDAGNEEA